jgi:hypothetical protein
MATVAVVLALGGGAYAASSFVGSGGQIRGCVSKSGKLTLLKAGKHCKKGRKPIAWNSHGNSNADLLDNLDSSDFQRAGAGAGGALAGNYPAPRLKPSESWNEVGDGDGPPFAVAPGSCTLSGFAETVFQNYGSGYSTAAFYRDPLGIVHIKGVVDLMTNTNSSECDKVFILPPDYRPPQREIFPGVSSTDSADPTHTRIDVTTAGEVIVRRTGSAFTSLDGIAFRCAPSGSNGCP